MESTVYHSKNNNNKLTSKFIKLYEHMRLNRSTKATLHQIFANLLSVGICFSINNRRKFVFFSQLLESQIELLPPIVKSFCIAHKKNGCDSNSNALKSVSVMSILSIINIEKKNYWKKNGMTC